MSVCKSSACLRPALLNLLFSVFFLLSVEHKKKETIIWSHKREVAVGFRGRATQPAYDRNPNLARITE